MGFSEKLKALAQRVPRTLDVLETEEATKAALVMPFIAALGYDVFDPEEVVPEFTADIGTKKGEKVDYAIKRGDDVMILIEAKKATEPLSFNHSGQLYRYFSVTKARIAVLTNGVQYRFYSDLDEPNRMDEKPFLELDLLDLRDNLISQAARLSKESFDLDDMLEAANDLKYMGEIRRILERQVEDPDEEFVKFFFSQAVPNGRFVQSARAQFSRLVKQAINQFIGDRVSDRLRSALERESGASSEAETESVGDGDEAPDDRGVVTTDEELEAFRIVKAIVCAVLPAERIVHRDTKSYFGVLADDNNRKPICRLHFNRSRKYIGIFDENKNETRKAIETVEDLYRFADELRETAQRYVAAE